MKNSWIILGIVLFFAGSLCAFYFLPSYRPILGWAGIALVILANLCWIKKYYIFWCYRGWKKKFEEKSKNFLKAMEEFQGLQEEIQKGILSHEAEDKGDDILDTYSFLEEYQTQIVQHKEGSYAIPARRDTTEHLHIWITLHILTGTLGILLCFFYIFFSFGDSFIIKIIFLLLFMILSTGISYLSLSFFIDNHFMTEKKVSLEYLEYLEEIAKKNLLQTARKYPVAFQKRIKKILSSLLKASPCNLDSIAGIKKDISEEEKQAFQKILIPVSQWHRIYILLKPTRTYRILQRISFHLHISLSFSLFIFSFLYFLGYICYR